MFYNGQVTTPGVISHINFIESVKKDKNNRRYLGQPHGYDSSLSLMSIAGHFLQF